ncbi:D-cysteine desulfhydrase family protein [Legionella fallonii]|uniref:1-aminocyclopropane-1-carboxylate deaminase n=1 Tax=Legionella fallonii LLAP-10 TaxID=1212491 RepID=A0A098G0Q6_9GAMM|nr:D-cysteine desulfhydrase family protein [Legionella fallonii]CEG56097.1 1-aminocyclopropane-1-carboxylate deaminase [Legionella fallonii LLAP-10]
MSIYHHLNRVNLGFFPTPLVFLKNLTAHLNGPQIYMKRDDCTGLATGGNKTRKLEFLLAQALEQQCDTLLTAGGMQSNHVRQTAAAAAQFGLKCVAVVNESRYREDVLYKNNGNIVLDRIFGATLHIMPKETNVEEEMDRVYRDLKKEGAKPYLIPLGGSSEIGAMGYVAAAEETYQQCKDNQIDATHLICAVGTGGTQSGLVIGKHLNDWDVAVQGFSVGVKNPVEKIRVSQVLDSTCRLLNINPDQLADSYEIDEDYIGIGYGQTTPESLAAIKLVAQTEGILLDPVYTGKAMAGLIDYIMKGRFKKSDVIVFFHTGGTAALAAYANEF